MSLARFTMLLVVRSSETGLFRHLCNNIFRVRNFLNAKAMTINFDWKHLKFNLDFKKEAKNWENAFCFWENCIGIWTVKLSLLRTGYFSSRAGVFTSDPKIWHVNKRDFFQTQLTWHWSMNMIKVLRYRF